MFEERTQGQSEVIEQRTVEETSYPKKNYPLYIGNDHENQYH